MRGYTLNVRLYTSVLRHSTVPHVVIHYGMWLVIHLRQHYVSISHPRE